MANTIAIGSLVMVGSGPARKYGTVSFIGETQFSNGEWIGIILQTPDGKNDGSVDGVRYFECERLYGLFVRRVIIAFRNDFCILTCILTLGSSCLCRSKPDIRYRQQIINWKYSTRSTKHSTQYYFF